MKSECLCPWINHTTALFLHVSFKDMEWIKINRVAKRLIDYTLFYVPLIWRRHRAAKFRPMLGVQGLVAGRDIYHATPTVTTGPWFFWSHPKDRPIQSFFTTHKGAWRIYSNPGLHSVASYDTQKTVVDIFISLICNSYLCLVKSQYNTFRGVNWKILRLNKVCCSLRRKEAMTALMSYMVL
jgi:hypothetical protein